MFTQKISMDCTKEQYEKYLKDELLKMGYREDITFANKGFGYVISNGIDNGLVADLWFENRTMDEEHYLGSFNAPLFLALAAMTDKAEGNYGEYVIGLNSGMFYKMKQDDKILPEFYNLRKATKEEIMEKFGKTETDTNYDAAREFAKYFCDNITKLRADITLNIIKNAASDAKEQLDAISLLKSKGYKILCKKETWEEV